MDLFEDKNEFQIDETKNYYEDLVGEGKKFKDNEALAKGKAEADNYVEIMKLRMDELRSDYEKLREQNQAKANLEDYLDQLNTQKKTPVIDTTDDKLKTAYDPKEIESIVSSKITQHEVSKKEEANLNSVMGKLKERFGANYTNYLREQSEQLGLDQNSVNELARKSPNAFLKTFGLDQPAQTESFQSPPRNSGRMDKFSPKGSSERTWSYYQNLKKTNPDLYRDPKITVQMYKDAELLGDAFKDGDFHAYGD